MTTSPGPGPVPSPEAAGSPAGRAEIRLLLAVQRRTTSAGALRVARTLNHAGEHAGAWLALGAVGAVVDRPRRREWAEAVAGVLVAHAASVVVKRMARRVRPVHDQLLAHVPTPSHWSFPSSHATSTTTAALVYAPLLGRGVLALSPAMAWSRLALGVHYPSDVLSGTALGAAVGLLVRRRQARRGAPSA